MLRNPGMRVGINWLLEVRDISSSYLRGYMGCIELFFLEIRYHRVGLSTAPGGVVGCSGKTESISVPLSPGIQQPEGSASEDVELCSSELRKIRYHKKLGL